MDSRQDLEHAYHYRVTNAMYGLVVVPADELMLWYVLSEL